MKKYLILISLDALNSQDVVEMTKIPIFRQFLANSAFFPEVNSIYPSLTYCAHTSIITGRYPQTHGIHNNELCSPANYNHQDWFWYAKDIKVPTLFDIAKKNGLRTASVLWPVMAGSSSIDYNVPEIFSNQGESAFKLFWTYGSKKLLPIVLKHRHKMQGQSQPYLDDFSEAVFLDILANKRPNLAALHLTSLDSARHHHGLFSEEARRELHRLGQRVERIVRLTKKMGIYHQTHFVLLGDHGFNNFHSHITLNSLFRDNGLLAVNNRQEITDWEAFASYAGGSAHIYLKQPRNTSIQAKVEHLLDSVTADDSSPIRQVMTRHQVAKRYHLDGPFSYVVEAADGYVFRNQLNDQWLTPANPAAGDYVGDHGYRPEHPNLKTMLLIRGSDIRKGIYRQPISLVNEGPTFAKLLDLELPNTANRILNIWPTN